jgi:hypothetical protein
MMLTLLDLTFSALLALIAPAAADPSVRLMDGQPFALSAEPTVLVYWSVGCKSCWRELEAAEQLAAQGVRVLAVNNDPAQLRSRALPALALHGIDLPAVEAARLPLQAQDGTLLLLTADRAARISVDDLSRLACR